MANTEARWCVEEEATDMVVANGSAPTAEEASREAVHYAVQYAQDGPVRWWVLQNRKTVLQGRLAGVSITVQATAGGELRKLLAEWWDERPN